METAMFGAGCFWGVEAAFRSIPGVKEAAVGYSGGKTDNPAYHEVCSDETGHAEVIQVQFDPAQVSYEQLCLFFFGMHDPTTLNRQGPDHGTQYRSAIFYYSPDQQAAATKVKNELNVEGKIGRPIVTEISPAKPFYRAEEYHQRYLEKRGLNSCHI